MKIAFRKIPYTKSSFVIKTEGLLCDGIFYKESNKIALLSFQVVGKTPAECDRCGVLFDLSVDENLSIKICEGVSDSEDLDIIECLNQIVDFDEIVHSEVASIKSDYHYCEKCKNEEGK